MIVVADSSPLIFLAMLNKLELLTGLYKTLLIPKQVRKELLPASNPPDDIYIIKKFLKQCKIESVPKPLPFSKGLSLADRAALTLAIKQKADRLLVDERLLRRIARAEGISTTGTIGVLYQAAIAGLLSPEQAQYNLRKLVKNCGFRISIAVYETAMDKFREMGTA